MKLTHGQRAAIFCTFKDITFGELSQKMGISKQQTCSLINKWKRDKNAAVWSKKNQERVRIATFGALNLTHPAWEKIEALLEKMIKEEEKNDQGILPLE